MKDAGARTDGPLGRRLDKHVRGILERDDEVTSAVLGLLRADVDDLGSNTLNRGEVCMRDVRAQCADIAARFTALLRRARESEEQCTSEHLEAITRLARAKAEDVERRHAARRAAARASIAAIVPPRKPRAFADDLDDVLTRGREARRLTRDAVESAAARAGTEAALLPASTRGLQDAVADARRRCRRLEEDHEAALARSRHKLRDASRALGQSLSARRGLHRRWEEIGHVAEELHEQAVRVHVAAHTAALDSVDVDVAAAAAVIQTAEARARAEAGDAESRADRGDASSLCMLERARDLAVMIDEIGPAFDALEADAATGTSTRVSSRRLC